MNKYSLLVIVVFILSAGVLWFLQLKVEKVTLLLNNQQTIDVTVAKTARQLYKGLGQKKEITNDGMLFVFGTSQKHGIVMRDMQFNLDIVWIDKGIVVDIASNVQIEPDVKERDLKKYFPRLPANLVLELPEGKAKEFGIDIGSTVGLEK